MRNEIRYEVDNRIVHIDHFDDNHALAEQGIAGAIFEDFISEAEEAFTEQQPPQKIPERNRSLPGDTVYLENDHPFTVEEIGIFDVHLRDEDFPLIGRAVSVRSLQGCWRQIQKTKLWRLPNCPMHQTPVKRQRLLRVKS